MNGNFSKTLRSPLTICVTDVTVVTDVTETIYKPSSKLATTTTFRVGYQLITGMRKDATSAAKARV
eukprot:2231434-Prymnesium_polylepis.1